MAPSNSPKPPEPSYLKSSRLINYLVTKNFLDSDKKMTISGHILLTGSLLIFVIVSYLFMLVFAGSIKGRWLNYCLDPIPQSQLLDQSNSTERIRLTQQLFTIKDLTKRHCQIMSFFYTQYYISLSMGSTAALVALLCTFFVSKEGWEKSNNALINLWVTSFSVTFLFLNIVQIFQQSENLKISQDLYAGYVVLQNEFLSSLAAKRLMADVDVEKFNKLNVFNESTSYEVKLIRYTEF